MIGDLNPGLRVPTLVLDMAAPSAESDAIIWYFADGTPYLPDDPFERAQVLQWCFFEQYSHEPNIAVARFWRIAGIEPAPAEHEAKQRGGEAALQAMERHLTSHEFFVGERYSIADIALYAYTHVAPEGGFELEPYPAIRDWLVRVMGQPGHIGITATSRRRLFSRRTPRRSLSVCVRRECIAHVDREPGRDSCRSCARTAGHRPTSVQAPGASPAGSHRTSG